jgi:2-phospho-L-lactate/phosphoenolpyruvate guanylyltransferase
MRTAAILPIKRFTAAKSRLETTVSSPLRGDLARAMVGDVLLTLARTAAIELTILVTAETGLPEIGREHRLLVVDDAEERGQSAAVTLGVQRALAEGFDRVLCVPGDCPALDPAELETLLAVENSGLVVLPDRHGTGTNGLLLAPPDAISPSFGPDSCARHLQLARAAGVDCRVEPLPSLLLDVDTGADLLALRQRLANLRERAESTRAVLARPEFTAGATVAAHA